MATRVVPQDVEFILLLNYIIFLLCLITFDHFHPLCPAPLDNQAFENSLWFRMLLVPVVQGKDSSRWLVVLKRAHFENYERLNLL